MRGRTLLAGVTLALVTLAWSAPAALAAPSEDSQPPTTTSREESSQDRDTDTPKPRPTQTATPTPTSTPEPKPSPRPEPRPTSTPTPSAQPVAPAIVAPRASVSVSPKTARPGDVVTATPRCEGGTVKSLTGEGVRFVGNRARIDADTAAGNHTVTLVCANGPEESRATDTFTVEKNGNGQPLEAILAVSPSVVRPGDTINSGAACRGGRIESLTGDSVRFNGTVGRVDDNARDGEHTITLVCANPVAKDTASARFRVSRGPGIGDPKATLSVSPRKVKQGDYIYANGYCLESVEESLHAEGVHFRGKRGWVDDNARLGEHTVTRVCRSGDKEDVATDTFEVVRGDGWDGLGPKHFRLSDRSGYRNDEIDLSVRCRDDRARVESTALDDVTLTRDGGRLRGTTHVEHDAHYGWHRVTVHCDGNSESVGFWVNRDRDHEKYLDLDPSYGHPGDEIEINVGCDWSVGEVRSDALDDVELDHDGRPWRYHATTHVEDDAEPGEHTVKVRCGDDTLEETFFVRGSDDSDDGDEPAGGEYVSVYPKGGVETGGGPVEQGQPNLGLIALGLTGIAGAGLAGVGSTLAQRSERG